MNTAKSSKSTKRQPCVCAAGLGERDVENVRCPCRNDIAGRSAIRAVFDNQGRWMVHWREAGGEEWVGTYRLIPC